MNSGEQVMSSEAIRPSTIDGIKRLSTSLKREQGIPHLRALDEAAQIAGFQNFRHASNVLPKGTESKRVRPRCQVFITAYWKDRKLGSDGRETLTISLSTPWANLITSAQLLNHRALMHFRGEGPDHLARINLVESQSQARRAACAAARALQFMDATKLRPSKGHSKAFPGGRSTNAVPGRDHGSVWYEPESKRYLFVDEPYEAAVNDRAAERATWATKHGYEIVKVEWAGIYNPDGGSRLYLVADSKKGVPLAPIAKALNALHRPLVEAAWDGESTPMTPIFVSPGTIAKIAESKAKVDQPRTSKTLRNTIGYVQTFVGPQRRPKGKMPIEQHASIGALLKSVVAVTYNRKGVYNRVNAIRSELDEWTQREYSYEELPNDQFFDLYYGEKDMSAPRALSAEERNRHIDSLLEIKQTLAKHYPDSQPLRSLFQKVDIAIKSMRTWCN
jgi:hypothetical protein